MEHQIGRGGRTDGIVTFGLEEDFSGERDYESSLDVGKVLEEGDGEVVTGDPESHTSSIAAAVGGYASLLLLRRKTEIADDHHPEVLKVA